MANRSQASDPSTRLTRAVGNITGWLGSFPAILISFFVVSVWFTGAFVVKGGFSNTNYQLIINTWTTIITFWMVFIIQNTQNREGRAMQTKLDAHSEILRQIAERLDLGDHRELTTLIGVEDAPEDAIKAHQDRIRDGSDA